MWRSKAQPATPAWGRPVLMVLRIGLLGLMLGVLFVLVGGTDDLHGNAAAAPTAPTAPTASGTAAVVAGSSTAWGDALQRADSHRFLQSPLAPSPLSPPPLLGEAGVPSPPLQAPSPTKPGALRRARQGPWTASPAIWPPSKPPTEREVLSSAFNTTGWLIHMMVHTVQSLNRMAETHSLLEFAMGSLDSDCGRHCAAFSYWHASLPLVKYSWEQQMLTAGLIYAATPDVWDNVQCMCVRSSSHSKEITTRARPRVHTRTRRVYIRSPFERPMHRYIVDAVTATRHGCTGGCNDGDPSDRCKELWAGCGRKGNCDVDWCSPEMDPSEWNADFFQGGYTNFKQCAFRASQRGVWNRTLAAFFEKQAAREESEGIQKIHNSKWIGVAYENEVNMYVSASTRKVLLDNLLALFYDPDHPNQSHLEALRKLRDHLRQLGKDVPILSASSEKMRSSAKWQRERSAGFVDAFSKDGPWHMEIVD